MFQKTLANTETNSSFCLTEQGKTSEKKPFLEYFEIHQDPVYYPRIAPYLNDNSWGVFLSVILSVITKYVEGIQ